MSVSLTDITLAVHAASTLSMTGLIWFVQAVHYPLMARVGDAGYPDYQHAHMKRTTWVVAPLMLAELASAVLLVPLLAPEGNALTITGLVLLALVWGSTAALQVPAHNRMLAGFCPEAHRRLVATNWLRTLLWSVRGVIACVLLGAG